MRSGCEGPISSFRKVATSSARVREILDAGAKKAGATAEATMQVVRGAMNLLPRENPLT